MIKINVPNMNDCFTRISIDGDAYLIRTTYNKTAGLWTLGVYTDENTPIIAGMRIIPNYPMNAFFKDGDMPFGYFTVMTEKDSVDRDDFANDVASLYYVSGHELPSEVMRYVGIR